MCLLIYLSIENLSKKVINIKNVSSQKKFSFFLLFFYCKRSSFRSFVLTLSSKVAIILTTTVTVLSLVSSLNVFCISGSGCRSADCIPSISLQLSSAIFKGLPIDKPTVLAKSFAICFALRTACIDACRLNNQYT